MVLGIITGFLQSFIFGAFYIDISVIMLLLLNILRPFYLLCIFAFLLDILYMPFFTFKAPVYLILLLFMLILDRFFIFKNDIVKIGYMTIVYLPISVFLCYLYNSLNITYTLTVFFATTCMLILLSFVIKFAIFLYKKYSLGSID